MATESSDEAESLTAEPDPGSDSGQAAAASGSAERAEWVSELVSTPNEMTLLSSAQMVGMSAPPSDAVTSRVVEKIEGVASVLLTPPVLPGPAWPAESPALLMLLGWGRRESLRNLTGTADGAPLASNYAAVEVTSLPTPPESVRGFGTTYTASDEGFAARSVSANVAREPVSDEVAEAIVGAALLSYDPKYGQYQPDQSSWTRVQYSAGDNRTITVMTLAEPPLAISSFDRQDGGPDIFADDFVLYGATLTYDSGFGLVFGLVSAQPLTVGDTLYFVAGNPDPHNTDLPFSRADFVLVFEKDSVPQALFDVPVIPPPSVVPPNSAPTAVGDGPFTVVQGGALTLTWGQLLGNDVDPDKPSGDVLAVNSVFASQGTVVNNVAAKTVTYTPVAGYTGPASFIYRVKDSSGAVSANTATVALIAKPNTAPAAVNDGPFTTNEDTPLTLTANQLVGNDIDPDPGSILRVNSVGGATGGTVKLNPNGTVTFTPTSNYHGPASFVYRIKDAVGAVSANTGTVSVTVTPVNDAPEGGVLNITGVDNITGVVTGSITGSTDPDGDTIRYVAAPTMKGTVTIDAATRTFTYIPSAAARQRAATIGATTADMEDIVVVAADDGHSGVTPFGIAVPVVPVSNDANRAPVAGVSTVGTPNTSTGEVRGTVGLTDPDGDPLTYTLYIGASKGSVDIDQFTGAFTYTPSTPYRHAAAFPGAAGDDKVDGFTIIASDQRGGVELVPINVVISPANAGPVVYSAASTGTATITGVVTGQTTFYDSDGDTLTYTSSTPVTGGTVSVASDGTFTYTPSAVARQNAASSTATAADRVDSFTITATDGYGSSATNTVVVPILPTGGIPNTAPYAAAFVLTDRDSSTGATKGTVSFTDRESDTLTFTATQPTKGTATIDSNTGAFTYTPSAAARHAAAAAGATDDDIRDKFGIFASDAHGNATPIEVNIAVGVQNSTPTLATNTVGTPNATTGIVTGKVTATDTDNDTIVYVGPTTTAKGSLTVDRATGDFTYTPAAAARFYAAAADATTGDKFDTFTITAYDNHGGYVTNDITVTISPSTAANRAPIQTAPTTVGAPDPITGEVTGDFHLIDLDRDGITYTFQPIAGSRTTDGFFVADDPRLAVDGVTGKWTFIPTNERRHEAALEFGGRPDIYSFHWTATDSRGATTSGDVTVPIAPANRQPVVGAVATQNRNTTTGIFTGTFTGIDPDGDYLDVSIYAPPEQGTAAVEWVGGTTYQWTYKPTVGQSEDAQKYFYVTVTDAHGGLSYVFANPDPHAPTTTSSPVTTGLTTSKPTDPLTGAIGGQITVANPAGRTLTYQVTGVPTKGTVSINASTGAYTFTPSVTARQAAAAIDALTSSLTDGFTVTVKDGAETFAVVPVKVAVSPLNRRPRGVANQDAPTQNGTISGRLVVTDPDGDMLSYQGETVSRLGGDVQIGSDGSFTYIPSVALRRLAARRPDVKDYFVVTVTEQSTGRKTDFRVVTSVIPLAASQTTPTLPAYPPTIDPGGGSGGSTPPSGATINDFRNYGSLALTYGGTFYPSWADKTQVTLIYSDPDPSKGEYIRDHEAVTVTVPADWVGYNGYLIQVANNVVTGYQKLEPGVAVTGTREFVAWYGGSYGFVQNLWILTVPSGNLLPSDLLPNSGPNGGGTPPSGPGGPYDGFDPALEDGIRQVNATYCRTACIASLVAGSGSAYLKYAPPARNGIARVIGKMQDQITDPLADEADQAAIELLKECLQDDSDG